MKSASIFSVVLLMAIAVGCGGKQQPPDVSTSERRVDGDPANLDAVTSVELDASPCGNPDWSRLPDESEPNKQPE